MNNAHASLLSQNIADARRGLGLTQEALAEKIGVSRQTVSDWERGDAAPDIENVMALAHALGTTIDSLVGYDAADHEGIPLPPSGKHIFGTVTVGERGQIVIPKPARELFNIKAGDSLVVLGDENQGIAIMKADDFLSGIDQLRSLVESSGLASH